MASTEKLIDIMNNFDNSDPLVAGFSSANLANISKSLNSENKHEADAVKASVPNKVKSLVKIINKVVENVNANLKSKYPDMKPFRSNECVTYNAFGATGKIELIEAGNDNHLSFNIKKLSKLPALEVIALVTKSIVQVVAKDNQKEQDETFVQELLSEQTLSDDDSANKNVNKAKQIIAEYLKNYLPTVYADDFKHFRAISEFVANQIVSEIGEQDIEKILSQFFDIAAFGIDDLATAKVDLFLGKSHSARMSKILGTAADFAVDPEKEILSISYEQQAQALIGGDVSDPNYGKLAQKFEATQSGEKCLTGSAVKEFCEFYVHNFLSAHNVKDIDVTFDNKGALGTFYDNGNSHSININLQKLKKMGSFAELAMTLSHELTHAVDASRNKAEGKYNLDGSGLLNDISEDISGSGATGDAKALLVRLKRMCYHVNPNERHARMGELSALMFMQKMAGGNSALQEDMKKSVARYVKYQQKTIDMIQSLPSQLSEVQSEFERLVLDGSIKQNGRVYNMVQERILYLREQGLGKSVEEEVRSQEIARRTLEQNQAEVAKKKAQEDLKANETLEDELAGMSM